MPGPGNNPYWPDVRIYVDFTNPGADNVYTWTDISQYCHRLGNGQLFQSIRGRNYERAQTDSGTFTFVLDNSLGTFDPTNTASPFYPNVKPIRKVQVTAKWAGTTHVLFTGRVEEWPRVWKNSGFWGEVNATARGVFSSLANIDLSAPWVNAAVIDGATAIYRLNDPNGEVLAANSSSFQQLYASLQYTKSTTAASKANFGGASGTGNLAGDPTPSLTFAPEVLPGITDGRAGYYLSTALRTDASNNLFFQTNTNWSWEGWFQFSQAPSATGKYFLFNQSKDNGLDGFVSQVYIYALGGPGNGMSAAVQGINSTNGMFWNLVSIVPQGANDAIGKFDGDWHHFAMTYDHVAGAFNLYVDGVVGIPSVSGPWRSELFTEQPYTQYIGNGLSPLDKPGLSALNGNAKNLAWYQGTTLTAAQVLEHFHAGQGYPGEDTGARITRLLSYANYPATADVGNSLLGATAIEDKNVIAAIENENDTELGDLYETVTGNVGFKNRQSRFVAPVRAVFGEGFIPYQIEDFEIQQDPREIYTTVIINRYNGATFTLVDTSSANDYFPRTLQINSNDYTDSQALYLGQYQVSRYKVARSRIPSLTIKPSANIGFWSDALNLDLGDRVTVNRNNPGAPPIVEDYFIEKITHDVSVGEWKVTYMLSSASLWGPYLILDDPVRGKIDAPSNNQLAF